MCLKSPPIHHGIHGTGLLCKQLYADDLIVESLEEAKEKFVR